MGELRVALAQLAEQDPLINVRQDDLHQELTVSLYGEVQEQVVQATLASDYSLEVTFRDTTPICIERPTRSGEAIELLNGEANPFHAEIGLRVEPAPEGNGVDFRLSVGLQAIPLYVYKTKSSFSDHMEEYVRETLREGVFGWEVTDCVVTMTRCWYTIADGPPSRRGPLSTAADFRKLTPIVLMEALERARPAVCVPIDRAALDLPVATLGVVIPALVRLDVAVETPSIAGERATVEAVVPADRVYELQRLLPALTGGEGVVETEFGGYQPLAGDAPTRRRTRPNPLNRQEYLMQLALGT
jgi:ribosomal protection tetracycline resistance protein